MTKGDRVLRGERLKLARENKHLGQEDFIDISVSQSQMSRFESGRHDPSTEILKKLAIKLEVSTDYLLGLIDEPRGELSEETISDEERGFSDWISKLGSKKAKELFDKKYP